MKKQHEPDVLNLSPFPLVVKYLLGPASKAVGSANCAQAFEHGIGEVYL